MSKAFATTSERIKVPHDPLYVEYYDRGNFLECLSYQFPTLIETHKAWLIMLAEKKIIPPDDIKPVLTALDKLKSQGPQGLTYTPGFHDVYTHMERWLKDNAPEAAVAHLSLGGTRPEPLMRMCLRERIVNCIEGLLNFNTTLLDNAEKYKEAVMPGYTHQQYAQPTTFGAYLLAFHEQSDAPKEESRRL